MTNEQMDAPSRKGADNDSHGQDEQGSPSPSFRGEPRMLSDEEIEKLAVEHEAFGFGRVDERGLTTHGFDPDGLRDFARAILSRAGIGGSRDE